MQHTQKWRMTAESRSSGGSNSLQSKFPAFTLLCIHLRSAPGSTSQILSFSFQFFSFSFRLLASAKKCKGAEPWYSQDMVLFPCGFLPPVSCLVLWGNCAAFPVKSQPLWRDHTACYILTYFWSLWRTCFTMIPVQRAFTLGFTHICESVNDALPLCCLQQWSAPHIWLSSASAFYAEGKNTVQYLLM